jgi:hypothetical protein
MNGDATAPLPAIAEATPEDILNACAQLSALMEETQKYYKMAAAGSVNNTALVGLSNQVADAKWWLCKALEQVAESYDRAAKAMSIMDVIEQNPVPAVTEPQQGRARHRAPRKRQPGERPGLSVVMPGFVIAAFAALKRLAPHMSHAKLVAAVATVGTGGAALAITGAVVITSSHSGAAASGAGSSSSVPGWRTSASPIPSSSLAGSVKHARAAAKRRPALSGVGAQVPLYGPGPGPSLTSASPSASASASVTVGDAAIGLLAFTTLDLSNPAVTSVTFTLSATGTAGWVSWKIAAGGIDLDFSPDHGVLQAGGSTQVTVSLASVLDSLTQQTFTVTNGQGADGQSVTVSLPLPVSSVLPSPIASTITGLLPSPSPS